MSKHKRDKQRQVRHEDFFPPMPEDPPPIIREPVEWVRPAERKIPPPAKRNSDLNRIAYFVGMTDASNGRPSDECDLPGWSAAGYALGHSVGSSCRPRLRRRR